MSFSIIRLSSGRPDKAMAEMLAEMEQQCFPEDPWSVSMFTETMENPAASFWLLKDIQLSKFIAYGVIYQATQEGDLANIAVLPEYRRQGVGRLLLKKMLEDAEVDGILQLFLEVRSSNLPAQKLYESFAFQIIGKRRNYYRHPREDALLMVRSLHIAEEGKDEPCTF